MKKYSPLEDKQKIALPQDDLEKQLVLGTAMPFLTVFASVAELKLPVIYRINRMCQLTTITAILRPNLNLKILHF